MKGTGGGEWLEKGNLGTIKSTPFIFNERVRRGIRVENASARMSSDYAAVDSRVPLAIMRLSSRHRKRSRSRAAVVVM